MTLSQEYTREQVDLISPLPDALIPCSECGLPWTWHKHTTCPRLASVFRCRKSYLVQFHSEYALKKFLTSEQKLILAIFGNPAGRYSYSIPDGPPDERVDVERVFGRAA